MPSCLIGLGSNLGDRFTTLRSGLDRLQAHPAIQVQRTSSFHETKPIGGPAGQGSFLNGAALLEVSLSPPEMLRALQHIEHQLRRVREARWDARTIDLDLLLYDDLIWNSENLKIPHPRLAWRAFVLEPAAEIATSWRHPQLGWTIGELLRHLRTAPNFVSISGLFGSPATRLARALVDLPGCRLASPPPRHDSGETTDPARSAKLGDFPDSKDLPTTWNTSHAPDPLQLDPQTCFQLARRQMRDYAAALQKSGPPPPASSTAWLVSDYWLPDSLYPALAFPLASLLRKEVEELHDELEQVSTALCSPKLTVLFTDGESSSSGTRTALLHEFVARHARGPRLLVPADDFPQAVIETRAALDAMTAVPVP